MFTPVRRILSVILVVAGMILLGWGVLPSRPQTMVQVISPTEMQLPDSGMPAVPTLLEFRRMSLEWPANVRIGDMATIRLVYEPINSEIIVEKPPVNLSDAYADYNVMVEGKFEVAGLLVDPANPRRESLPKGETVTYQWKVRAQAAGHFAGTIWLSLRFLPLDGSPASQVPVYVHDVDIRATSLFGLSGPAARAVGGLGFVGGIGLSFDRLIYWVEKRYAKKDTKVTTDTKEI